MKQLSELQFIDDVVYFEEHTWVKKDGENVVVGISDYAQDQLGEIIFVELPEPGDTFVQNDVFGSVESVKTSSELYMPIGGTVVAINMDLEDAPEMVNSQPYGSGWMLLIKPDNPCEIDDLSSAKDYVQALTD